MPPGVGDDVKTAGKITKVKESLLLVVSIACWFDLAANHKWWFLAASTVSGLFLGWFEWLKTRAS